MKTTKPSNAIGVNLLSKVIISPPGFYLVLVAVLTIVWGFWLWNPFWGGKIFEASTSYNVLKFLIKDGVILGASSEEVWGSIFSAVGVLLMGYVWQKKVLASQILLASLIFLWSLVTVSFGVLNFTNTEVVTYGAITALHIILYLKVFSGDNRYLFW